MSAVWASQKIMEHSERWRRQIEPAQPVNISPELKVHSLVVVFCICALAGGWMLDAGEVDQQLYVHLKYLSTTREISIYRKSDISTYPNLYPPRFLPGYLCKEVSDASVQLQT